MTSKAEFDAEQWSVVVGAPLLAAMMVIAADRGGSVRETMAVARAYASARETHEAELMRAILASAPAPDASQRSGGRDDLGRDAVRALREAISILDRVADEDEVVEYKRFVFGLAESAARAHSEGGLLRRGASEISDLEQAALDEIAAVFDEPPGA
jgi:hypothetical protein